MYTPEGWLIMYHGVRQTTSKISYRLGGLVLLDLKDPRKVLRRSEGWVFGPHEWYERSGGDVNDVVFPCGWVVVDGNSASTMEARTLLYPLQVQKWMI